MASRKRMRFPFYIPEGDKADDAANFRASQSKDCDVEASCLRAAESDTRAPPATETKSIKARFVGWPEYKQASFMGIPGELRNRIYHYVLDDIQTTSIRIHRDPNATRHLYGNPIGEYFSLTQACRGIRTEFRPLWVEKVVFKMTVEDLPLYIKTFTLPNREAKEQVGNIWLTQLGVRTRYPGLSILQGLIFNSASPNFKLDVHSRWNATAMRCISMLISDYDKILKPLIEARHIIDIRVYEDKDWWAVMLFEVSVDMGEKWGEKWHDGKIPEELQRLGKLDYGDSLGMVSVRFACPIWRFREPRSPTD